MTFEELHSKNPSPRWVALNTYPADLELKRAFSIERILLAIIEHRKQWEADDPINCAVQVAAIYNAVHALWTILRNLDPHTPLYLRISPPADLEDLSLLINTIAAQEDLMKQALELRGPAAISFMDRLQEVITLQFQSA